MPKPTRKQIQENVNWLRSNKEKVRRYTAFNDDNWKAIEATIEVMESNMTEDAIFDKRADENDEAQMEDDALWNGHTSDAALQARHWMDGDEDESPKDSYAQLATNP